MFIQSLSNTVDSATLSKVLRSLELESNLSKYTRKIDDKDKTLSVYTLETPELAIWVSHGATIKFIHVNLAIKRTSKIRRKDQGTLEKAASDIVRKLRPIVQNLRPQYSPTPSLKQNSSGTFYTIEERPLGYLSNTWSNRITIGVNSEGKFDKARILYGREYVVPKRSIDIKSLLSRLKGFANDENLARATLHWIPSSFLHEKKSFLLLQPVLDVPAIVKINGRTSIHRTYFDPVTGKKVGELKP